MAKRATLVEIARASGVTASTVSQVLTGNYGRNFSVRPQVRDRILKIAAEMNYRPNLAARSLSQGRTNLVSIVGSFYLTMVMEFYRSALGAIKTELAKEKLDLLVTIPHESGGSELPHWRIDAAIIIQQCQLRTIEELHQHSYPHVVLNGILDDQTPAVLADDVQGMRLVIDHLYGLGHRRIAYAKNANDQDSDHYSIALRHDAYKAEMAARGLPCIDPYDPAVVPVGADFLKRTVLEQQATAIVGYSHAEAMTLMQAAMAMGIAIPSQLSLVCFNDMYPLSFMSIPLTMVRIPTEEMGQAAAQLLLKMLKNDCQTRRLTFPEELIVRASTAEPVR